MPGVTTPPIIVEGFGINAGGSYIQNPIPVASQIGISAGRASYNDGFVPLNSVDPDVGGVAPWMQDFNGVLFAATQNLAAMIGGQYTTFSAAFATANGGYATGAIIPMANELGYWLNTVSGNSNNPDTTAAATSGWVPLVSYGAVTVAGLVTGVATLTAAQASAPILVFSGTLTGNVQITLPVWIRQWLVVNNCTGAFALTLKTSGGTGAVIPPSGAGAPSLIYGDGTNIYFASQNFAAGVVWTPTWTGFSAPPTGNATYSLSGNIASINFGSIGLGTSNGTGMGISNLPAAITPQASLTIAALVSAAMEDNGSGISTPCSASINYLGAISFYKGLGSGAWTNSGSKGFAATGGGGSPILTYPLS